jgi:hypothetical protein
MQRQPARCMHWAVGCEKHDLPWHCTVRMRIGAGHAICCLLGRGWSRRAICAGQELAARMQGTAVSSQPSNVRAHLKRCTRRPASCPSLAAAVVRPGLVSHDACMLSTAAWRAACRLLLSRSALQSYMAVLFSACALQSCQQGDLCWDAGVVAGQPRRDGWCVSGGAWGDLAGFIVGGSARGSASARCADASPHCMLQQSHASGCFCCATCDAHACGDAAW